MRTHETGVVVYKNTFLLPVVYGIFLTMGLLIAEMKKMTVFETQYISKLLSFLELCIIQPGMTNYRIDRIDTEFDHIDTAYQGQVYTNIGRTVTGMNNG